MPVAIETKDLTKVFNNTVVAVYQLSMTIDEGEIFAFLGPNGAGKTTTVRLLACLLTPTKGTAIVNGYDITEDQLKIRKNIGILTDRPNLYLRLTARRNLLFFAKMYGMAHEEASKRIESLARQFDLIDRLDSPVGSFSKGMKQKLGIFRAMIHNPEILFFDEPTAGLDPITSRTVRETIETTAKELDTTVFLTTHNLPEAEKLANKIGVINRGELITLGTTSELKNQLSKIKKVTITCLDDVNAYRSHLEKIGGIDSLIITEKNSLELHVEDIEGVIPTVVRSLVEQGASIVRVEPYKTSLEEVYYEVMKTNGGTKNAA
ncbi:MAG: ATP-binding cassette domain-containing protein [Candidatus Hermodarchaeota archaeon]